MSKTSLLFGIILLILSSCSAIKDAITVPVTTNLQVDVPITVASVKSANLNDKAVTFYSFTATKVLQVADNVDMTSYINKIKSVDLRGVTVTIATLTGSDQVLTLDLAVTGITGPVFSIANIGATLNNPFSPTISAAVQSQFNLVEAKLVSDRALTITITGTTNNAPLTLTAKLAFDAKFTCAPLN